MKTSKFSAVICLLFWGLITKATAQDVELFIIEPFPLEITYNKTVNLIFPFPVQSVDKGSRAILAQKAKGVENILQVKAANLDFQQTNLTVITADGKLYSFVVNYSAEPSQLNIELIKSRSVSKPADALLAQEPNQAFLKEISQQALADPNALRKVKDSANKARLSLSGLFINNDVIFFRLKIDNRSNISYQIESIRFFISDKRRVKRAAAQQRELSPLYVHKDTSMIQANQTHELVFALPKFTLPHAEQLRIEMMEQNGGRHLGLLVKNKNIIRAKQIL